MTDSIMTSQLDTALITILRRVDELRSSRGAAQLRFDRLHGLDPRTPPREWMSRLVGNEGDELQSNRLTFPAVMELVRSGVPVFCRTVNDSALLIEAEGETGFIVTITTATGESERLELPIPQVVERIERESGAMPSWFWIETHDQLSDQIEVRKLPPFKQLRELFQPDRSDVLAILAFAVAMGVLLLATPIAVQAVVNFVALGGAIPPLIVVALLLFGGLVLAAVLAGIQTWVVEILQRRLFVRVVADLAARLPRVALSTFDRKEGTEYVNRFFDIITIQKSASTLLLDGLNLALTVVVGLVLLAFYHPLLLAFDVLLILAIVGIVLGPMRRGVRTAIKESYAKHNVAGWLEELARNQMLYRSADSRVWLLNRTDSVVEEYLGQRALHYRVLFGQIIGALGLHVIASTALLGVGSFLVMNGSLSLGQLVAAELVVTMVVGAVAKIGKQLENFYDLMASTDKVGQLLSLPLEAQAGERALQSEGRDPAASFELSNVSLGGGDEPELEDITLSVVAGEVVGIRPLQGHEGRLLTDLLWGMRRPSRGNARLDGRDIRYLSRVSLRSAVSVLGRSESTSGSIRENLRLDRSFVTDDAIHDALDRVGLLRRIEELESGLETMLGPQGWPLSPPEFQCLQLARVLLGNPRLILVTEEFLTPAVANRPEVLDTLFGERAAWSAIVLSRSEHVLERCDRVVELPNAVTANASPEPSIA